MRWLRRSCRPSVQSASRFRPWCIRSSRHKQWRVSRLGDDSSTTKCSRQAARWLLGKSYRYQAGKWRSTRPPLLPHSWKRLFKQDFLCKYSIGWSSGEHSVGSRRPVSLESDVSPIHQHLDPKCKHRLSYAKQLLKLCWRRKTAREHLEVEAWGSATERTQLEHTVGRSAKLLTFNSPGKLRIWTDRGRKLRNSRILARY